MTAANPYSFTEPVRTDAMFFGRRDLREEMIANFTAPNPQSYTLVGGRRFGKTSLLRAVERSLLARLEGATAGQPGSAICVAPVYIDFNYDLGQIPTRGHFFALVLERLQEVLAAYLPAVSGALKQDFLSGKQNLLKGGTVFLSHFEEAFASIREAARPHVGVLQVTLLIDESEYILSRSWASELHANLRALLSNRPQVQDHLSMVMAGSSNFYAKINEEGSPLRNILLKRLLAVLEDDEVRDLASRPTQDRLTADAVDAIVEQSGGHPFLAQYLLYHLWRDGLDDADHEAVLQRAEDFRYEREDFDDWCRDLGPMGEAVYALLMQRGDWVRRSEIFGAVRGDRTELRYALEALSYHGLIRFERRGGYRTTGAMFLSWYREFRQAGDTSLATEPEGTPAKPAVQDVDGAANLRTPLVYADFELLVDEDGRVRVASDQGERSDQLQLDLSSLAPSLQFLQNRQTDAEFLKLLGLRLYNALFPIGLHGHLRASMAAAEAVGKGLRLRLTFESPALAALPWELLYDADTNTFLATATRTALSRYVNVPVQRRELRSASPPLSVLAVISRPSDMPALDADFEETLIRRALQSHLDAGRIELDVERDATIRTINQRLRTKNYNVFHFIGHGLFQNGQGAIALVDWNGRARLLDAERFSNLFQDSRSLGMVVLNACQGAAQANHDAFLGVAPALVRRGIPAVVAMQYAIRDVTAALFADEFYRTLALGWPVDAAIQSTRNAIALETGLDVVDFATPVLFMRARDGLILEGL